MKRNPYRRLIVIVSLFVLCNLFAGLPMAANRNGNPSVAIFDETANIESSIEQPTEVTDSRIPTGEVSVIVPPHEEDVEANGRINEDYTDSYLPEDPPETTGRNYTMTTPAFTWDDATDGKILYLYDDDSTYYNLPWQFEFYGTNTVDLYVGSNGIISFTTDPMDNSGSFPSSAYEDTFAIAPFWTDLVPTGNIYVKEFHNPDRVVIQYDNIDYDPDVGEGLAGTFQAVVFPWGDIEFRYDWLQNMTSYTCGLNYGLDTRFYNLYDFATDPVDDLALRFEYASKYIYMPGINYTSSSDYTLNWLARSDVAIDNFHVYLDMTYNTSTTSMSTPLTGLLQGWHNIQVDMDTDGSNYTWTSDLVVDFEAPTVTIEYPLNDTTLTDAKANWTYFEDYEYSHSEVLVDGVYYGTAKQWSEEMYVLLDDDAWYNVTVIVYDAAGNYGADNVTIYYDRTSTLTGFITTHGESGLWEVYDLYQTQGHLALFIEDRLDEARLSYYDVLFVGYGSRPWASSEQSALEAYLSGGGILVTSIVDDITGQADSNINSILESYGIGFTGENNFNSEYTTNFESTHPLMTGISSIYFQSIDSSFHLSIPAIKLMATEDGTTVFGSVVDLADTKILALPYDFGMTMPLADNQLVFENILDYWLTTPSHDVRAYVDMVDGLGRNAITDVDVYVINQGTSTETSFTLELWIDNVLNTSLFVASLDSGDWTMISTQVEVTHTGFANITGYVTPVASESNLGNNQHTKILTIYEFVIDYPGDSAMIQGGLVWINYTCSDWHGLESLTGYLNDVEILEITVLEASPYSELMFPVFENGSNKITILALWENGVLANDSVTVESYRVVPLAELTFGNYYNMVMNMYDTPMQKWNFTFTNYISDLVVNCSTSISFFSGEYWQTFSTVMHVNLLNGYVHWQTPGAPPQIDFNRRRLLVFSGLSLPEVIPYSTSIDENALQPAGIGAKACFMDWNQVFTVIGIDGWNGYETLLLSGFMGADTQIEFLKSTGLLVYFKQGDIVEGGADATDLLPPIDRAPIVSSPDELYIPENAFGPQIEWVASGNNPNDYTLYVNGEVEETDSWQVGVPVFIMPDDLPPIEGGHNFTIVFRDWNGMWTSDTVWVVVQDVFDPTINHPDDVEMELDMLHTIIWNATDSGPYSYQILKDGAVVSTWFWHGELIQYTVDEIAGTYNFTVVVTDVGFHTVADTVMVTITAAVNPLIDHPPDFQYVFGSIPQAIHWQVSDQYPSEYRVYRDGSLIDEGPWDGSDITIDVSGLAIGVYEFTLMVYDEGAHLSSDMVVVTVISATPTTTTTTTSTTSTTSTTTTSETTSTTEETTTEPTTSTEPPPPVDMTIIIIISGLVGGGVIIIIIVIVVRKR